MVRILTAARVVTMAHSARTIQQQEAWLLRSLLLETRVESTKARQHIRYHHIKTCEDQMIASPLPGNRPGHVA